MKEVAVEIVRKKRAATKYEKGKKCLTEPDENANVSPTRRSKEVNFYNYNTNKVINEVEEKDSPLPRRKREVRTKEEFLASMTNWEQKRRLRQEKMAEREKIQSMNGVTFTPEINAKSKRLMKNRGDGVPIFERLLKAGTPKNGC